MFIKENFNVSEPFQRLRKRFRPTCAGAYFYILPLQVGYKKVGYKLLEEFGVDGCNSCVSVVLVDENGNLDFAGADHLDVDV